MLSLAGALLAGCGINARLGIGPTVDSAGRWGVEAKLSGGFGPGDRDYAISLDPHFTVGYLGLPGEAVSLGGGGGVRLTGIDASSVALTGSVFGGGRGHVGVIGERNASGSVGLDLGAGYALVNDFSPGVNAGIFRTDGSRRAIVLGLSFQLEVVIDSVEARGLFALPVYLQWFWGT